MNNFVTDSVFSDLTFDENHNIKTTCTDSTATNQIPCLSFKGMMFSVKVKHRLLEEGHLQADFTQTDSRMTVFTPEFVTFLLISMALTFFKSKDTQENKLFACFVNLLR